MQLHHRSGQVAYKHLDLAVDFFTEKLGCRVIVRMDGIVFLRQEGASVDLQLVGVPTRPAQDGKELSHIGFLSDDPHGDRKDLQEWLKERGHDAELGQWSDRELWLDIPGVFLDFVIELLDPQVLTDPDYPPTGE